MKLNPEKVPAGVRELIPMAEMWGIGDDFLREAAIRKASIEQLTSIVKTIEETNDSELYGWLSGPESLKENLSEEWVAFVNLTMAFESAKVQLMKLSRHDQDGV